MNKTYLITGGTGYLGSLLALRLIKQGDKVIILGRGKDGTPLKTRVVEKFNTLDANIPPESIETLEFDLQKNFLGIDTESINSLVDRVDGFWHLAANLSFKGKYREEVIATNVNGIKNVLDFIEKIKCSLYFVSTAYVCGKKEGLVYENDFSRPQAFNNAYEESKYIAENTVRDWSKKTKHSYIIFRPSILVSTDLKMLSFFGYYNIVYALHKWAKKLKKFFLYPFFIFPYYHKAILNLMPVDTTVDWMVQIALNKKAENKTYHIANPRPPLTKAVAVETFRTIGIKLILFKAPRWFIDFYFKFFYLLSHATKPSRSVGKNFFYYRYYTMQDAIFDLRNTKAIIGENAVNEFHFSAGDIKKIASEFIQKI